MLRNLTQIKAEWLRIDKAIQQGRRKMILKLGGV